MAIRPHFIFRFLIQHGIRLVEFLDHTGPETYGVRHRTVLSAEQIQRPFVMSICSLPHLDPEDREQQSFVDWIRTQTPTEIIRGSLYVYR